MKELIEVWRYREVLWNLVRRNLKVRYKNSILGFLWSLLNPLMQIGVWWLVFKVILGNAEENYTAFLITGFLPWLFFSQSVLDSTACVTNEMALLKKAYFPRTILPLASLFSNAIHLGFAFIVLIGLFAVWGVDVNIHYLLLIPATLLLALFAYGLSAMLAAWSVFYADIKFIVGNLLSLWFFLTPVLYPVHLVLSRAGTMPHNLPARVVNYLLPQVKQLYLIDPLAVSILGYRSALLQGGQNPIVVAAPTRPGMSEEARRAAEEAAHTLQLHLQAQYPIWHYVLGATLIAVAFAVLGHLVYQRLSYLFAERG